MRNIIEKILKLDKYIDMFSNKHTVVIRVLTIFEIRIRLLREK